MPGPTLIDIDTAPRERKMSTAQDSLNYGLRHRLTSLQTWVATSGCWNAASIAMPHNTLAVWISVAVGAAFAVISATIAMAIERRNSTRTTCRRRENLPWFFTTLPTFVGLLTATWAAFQSDQDEKSLITIILAGGHLVEMTLPVAARLVRTAIRNVLAKAHHAIKTMIDDAVRTHALASSSTPPTTPAQAAATTSETGEDVVIDTRRKEHPEH